MTLRCRQWGGCMKKGAPHPVYCKLIATVTTSIDIDIPIWSWVFALYAVTITWYYKWKQLINAHTALWSDKCFQYEWLGLWLC